MSLIMNFIHKRKKIYKTKAFLSVVLSVVFTFVFVALAASGSTTIGSSITTDGGLTVTGDINFSSQAFYANSSTGRVGIGTDSPSAKLSVFGDPLLVGGVDLWSSQKLYVSGDYAYVTLGDIGLKIIDVSTPSSPTLTGTYDTPGNASGVYVSGNYAYVADYGSGLQIIDISTPSSPTLTGTYDTPGDARNVYVSGNYAYVADDSYGLQIIDISTPSSPTLAGTYNTSGRAFGVYVSGNYAYVADYGSGLQIIDISTPSSPTLTGTYDTPGNAFGVYVSGNYAYVADGSSLQIIDISTPSSPALAGIYDNPGDLMGVYVSGNYAYLAETYVVRTSPYFQIIDVSDPSNPSLSAEYDIPGRAKDVYVSGNYAYLSGSVTHGLQIFNVNGEDNLFRITNTKNGKIMVVNSDGNVGIGTTSPYAKLSVVGQTVSSYFTATSNTSTSTAANGWDIKAGCFAVNGVCLGGGSGFVGSGTTGQFPYYAAAGTDITATSSIFIDSSGNIGIGTTTPYAKLSIWSNNIADGLASSSVFNIIDSASTTIFTVKENGNVGIGTSSPDHRLTLQNDFPQSLISLDARNLSNSYARISYRTDAFDWIAGAYNNNNITGFSFGSNYGGWHDVMTLINSGNVGIGTTSPYAKLSVVGQTVSSYFTATSNTSTSTAANGWNITAGCFAVNGVCLGEGGGTVGSGTTGQFPYYATAGTDITATSSIFIDSSGNIGINTTSPATKLSVAGFINTDQYSGYKQAGKTILSASSTNLGLFIGEGAGTSTQTTGWNNTFVGYWAGQANLGGDNNSFMGTNSGIENTGGYNNTFMGANAAFSNTVGSHNSYLGYQSGYYNTTGSGNSFIGRDAVYNNISATSSVAVGRDAARGTAFYNAGYLTVVGQGALYNITTGADYNTALGYQSGYGLTSGANNILVGASNITASQNQVTTGSNNISIGYNVALANPTSNNQLNIGNLIYGTGLDGAGTTLSSGNIGIGTTSPSYKLDIAGFINTDQYSGYKQAGNTILYASSTNYSTAVGIGAGTSTQATGLNNTFVGYWSGHANTTGDNNIALGWQAFSSNTTGLENTALGPQALYSNTTASQSNAIGYQALYSNNGNYNNAVGYQALYSNTTGGYNNAFGHSALQKNIGGGQNSAFGTGALYSNTTGSQNSAFGNEALRSNTTASYNSSLGYRSLYDNTTGQYNTAVGFESLTNNTTSGYNTAVGFQASQRNNGGVSNSSFGTTALFTNVTGSYNAAFGQGALYKNLASYNSAFGFEALRNVGSGTGNVASGYKAGWVTTDGSSNVLMGYRVGYGLSTGSNNILLGYQSGDNITTGSNNIIIGYNIDATSTDAVNQLNIGNLIYGTGLDGMGNTLSSGNIGIGVASPSYKLDVAGFINTDQYSGYKQEGNTILYASSTNYSTMVGIGAGTSTQATGMSNTFVGYWAGQANTTGDYNTAVGKKAFNHNKTGGRNVAIGDGALFSNTGGSHNNAVGFNALYSNTGGTYAGIYNNAFGEGALYKNTNNSNNAFGYYSLYNNISGGENNAMGYYALYSNTSGSYNNAIGHIALQKNTYGSNNNAIGYGALRDNTSGNSNNVMGQNALEKNTTGSVNVAIGDSALRDNLAGTRNTALGYLAMFSGGSGSYNTALGSIALSKNTGDYNSAIGYSAMSQASGNSNNALGRYAGRLSTGNGNIFIGDYAGDNLTAGNNNILIGYRIDAVSSTASNQLNIGNLIYGTGIDGQGGTLSSGSIGIGEKNPGGRLQISTADISTIGQIYKPYSSVDIVTFTGSGLNDAVSGGTFTGTSAMNYKVQIDAVGTPDTFKWSDDNGATWNASGVAITGSAQTLSHGVTITFGATTGHTLSEYWTFSTTIQTADIVQWQDPNGASTGAITYNESGLAFNTDNLFIEKATGNVGIGTTSPYAKLSVAGQTVSSYFTATSNTSTSTAANGWNITAGCFAVNGVCLGGGGGGSVGSGTIGQFPYYAANGTSLSATSSIFMAENGNVGIGTVSPINKLSVLGTAAAEIFRATSTTATSTFAGGVVVATNGLVYDRSTGRVGIGTASPSQKLDVVGSSGAVWIRARADADNTDIKMGSDGTGTSDLAIIQAGVGDSISFQVDAGSLEPLKMSLSGIVINDNASDINFRVEGTTNPNMLFSDAGKNMLFVGTNTLTAGTGDPILVVEHNGQTGPIVRFKQTNSAKNGFMGFYNDSNVALRLGVGGTARTGTREANWGVLRLVQDGTAVPAGLKLKTDNNVPIYFETNGDNPRLVVEGNGNIGIGTTSPYAKLSVVGQIVSSYFTATSTTSTSTAANGWNITAGCFAVNGTCIGGGGGGGTVTSVAMTTPTGLTVSGSPITSSGTLALSYNTGYAAVLTASTTNWNNFYNSPSARITAGTGLSWSANTLNAEVQTSDLHAAVTLSGTPNYLTISGQTITRGLIDLTTDVTGILPSSNIADSYLKNNGDTATGNYNFDGGTFFVDSVNNRVGIGTTSPSYKLDVAGNINVADGSYYKYGGQNAFRLATGTDIYYSNTLVGLGAGNSTSTEQTAVGYYAGNLNTGIYQTATGFYAGRLNTGDHQTVMGYGAGESNTGIYQTATGFYAGRSNTGFYQTAIGFLAGNLNTGNYQTSVGYSSGESNTGDYSTALGSYALKSNTANNVVAIGYEAGMNNSVANQFIIQQANINTVPLIQGDFLTGNVGIGTTTPYAKLSVAGFINTDQYSGYKQAGKTILYASSTNYGLFVGEGTGKDILSDGTWNTAVGYQSLYQATSSEGNAAFGYKTLYSNIGGNENTAIGDNALRFNTTGNNNSALGAFSLHSNMSGNNNSAVGISALYSNTTGNSNSAMGQTSLYKNTTGNASSAFGFGSLQNNISATSSAAFGYEAASGPIATSYNAGYLTVVGAKALSNITTGADYNTALGYRSGYGLTSGAKNVLIGASSIFASYSQITTGSNNISIGYNVAVASSTLSNQLNIGNLIYGTGLDGEGTTISSGNIGIGTTSPAENLGVAGRIYIGGTGTSTVENNLYVMGTLRATNSYVGDLIFSNGFRYVESEESAAVQALFLQSPNGKKRLAIDENGNIGIGTTTPAYPLDVYRSTDGDVAAFTDANGTCTINPTNTALICSSDRTLKKDIIGINDSLDIISALEGVSFRWNREATTSAKHFGFIAQEVEKVVPQLVNIGPDGKKAVNYTGFSPILVQAVKEMNIKVSDLEARMDNIGQTENSSLLDQILSWFKNTVVSAKEFVADTIRANKKLCIDDVCVNKEELKTLLDNAGIQAETDTQIPTTPTNLTASATSTSQIDLAWDASENAAGYRIYRDGNNIAGVTGRTTYSDTQLSASTTYSYSVSAYNGENESATSTSVSVMTSNGSEENPDSSGSGTDGDNATTSEETLADDTTAPTVPENLKAVSVSPTQIDLNWTASADISSVGEQLSGLKGYNVYENGSLVASTTAAAYSDSGLTASTTYSYAVSSYDAAGNESSVSGSVSTSTAGSI